MIGSWQTNRKTDDPLQPPEESNQMFHRGNLVSADAMINDAVQEYQVS